MLVENLNFSYSDKVIFKDLTLDIKDGKINFIMGASGVGKSTFITILKEKLLEEGKNISFVFQEDRLIEWKTVYDNLKFIKSDGNILEILESLGLLDAKDKYPKELSGGMKQRVNIGRALLYNGDVFIMDEPFKALDRGNKDNVVALVKEKLKGKTCIIVSHDKSEYSEIGDILFKFYKNPVEVIIEEK